ncbi:phosphate signaling complex protein PhoU [Peribacillus tepidiphilus]|uniref:phosphate signaling complex protein PhoU n=1 Tax=Peribacillus tepidiphilus TaxID=2652445 RepID=UPI0035B54603
MPVREKFDFELKELKQKLMDLGNLAAKSLKLSFEALEKQDIDLALKIIEDDTEADMLEEEINDFAILLIAKQQPVAIDLRRIIVAIKIASDIERMADFGVNIAKSAIRLGKESFITSLDRLKKMHELTLEMLELSLKAFNEEDVLLAKKIAEMDDEVDALYGEIIVNLLKHSNDNQQQVTQLSFVARYLERTADHATNVAESIYYLVRGRHFDLNN